MKLFLLLLIIVIPIIKASESDCNGEQLVTCYIEYFSNFLLPTIPIPPRYNEFNHIYFDLQSRGGWDTQEQLCGYQESLIQCMAYNRGCLNTKDFQRYLNMEESDARNYQTDFKVKEYECGSGRNDFQNIFSCYLKVLHFYDYELAVCEIFKNETIGKDGYNCSKACDYISCMSNIYGRRCGTAVKPFICNVAKITLRSSIESDACDMSFQKC